MACLANDCLPVVTLHLDSKEKNAKQQLKQILTIFLHFNINEFVLAGDLNINLYNNYENQVFLAELFAENGLKISKIDVENPVRRERSERFAYNQQISKGGEEVQSIKNLVFYLEIASCNSDYNYAELFNCIKQKKSVEMDLSGLDHGLASIEVNGNLYISFSNVPTQKNSQKIVNLVEDGHAAAEADEALRNKFIGLLAARANFQLPVVYNVNRIYEEVIGKFCQRWNDADLELQTAKFIEELLGSVAFQNYLHSSVKHEFKQAVYAELGEDVSQYSKKLAAEGNILYKERGKTRPDKILAPLMAAISPQPNNGYKPSEYSSGDMEVLRSGKVETLVKEFQGASFFVCCNDSRKSDYVKFHQLLKTLVNKYNPHLNLQVHGNKTAGKPLTGRVTFWKGKQGRGVAGSGANGEQSRIALSLTGNQ